VERGQRHGHERRHAAGDGCVSDGLGAGGSADSGLAGGLEARFLESIEEVKIPTLAAKGAARMGHPHPALNLGIHTQEERTL
jgi:hypothetical protein